MDIFTPQTPMPTREEALAQREWYVVDASGKVLGRLASEIAKRLRGKHKPHFAPHLDLGDFIVVVNAKKIKLTGKKWDQKVYWRHSGYMGGLKLRTARQMLETKPEELVRLAVKRMLPKNRLGRKLLKKLKVYAGPEHPHQAQNPKPLEL
ncbi:50S ribosomal protein L13 [Thermosulfurimonas sp.]|uniref:50S ribosomal protein L13 n=1 Tax=Thermosulfurimonas sp. TaxID=2080236 RepID=UPI0034208CA7